MHDNQRKKKKTISNHSKLNSVSTNIVNSFFNLVSFFNDISVFKGYLMPKPSL